MLLFLRGMLVYPLLRSAAITLVALMGSGSVLAEDGSGGLLMPGWQPSLLASGTSTQASRAWSLSSPLALGSPGDAPLTPDAALATEIGGAWMIPAMSGSQIWARELGRWSFTSLVGTSYLPNPSAASQPNWADGINPPNGSNGNLVAVVVPVIASYHISQTDRLTLSPGSIATAHGYQGWQRVHGSSDVWTFTPKIAYTRVITSADAESSTVYAVGVFSQKSVAIYQNAAVGRFEAVVMEQGSNGWGFGGVAAAIQQLNQEPPAYVLARSPDYSSNGGLALGAGPQVTWSTRWLGSNVELRYRWIYEFSAPNGHTEQPMMLSATLHL